MNNQHDHLPLSLIKLDAKAVHNSEKVKQIPIKSQQIQAKIVTPQLQTVVHKPKKAGHKSAKAVQKPK
ncbi:hypothetical protein ACE1TI_05435 [Alteribacillus sp. JSM 102045]|uniref:hypothetical protein n=1 Tax=Alteribacillus sp. JSM 102045 TaxID=1562101 RepID=UPI0035BF1FB2